MGGSVSLLLLTEVYQEEKNKLVHDDGCDCVVYVFFSTRSPIGPVFTPSTSEMQKSLIFLAEKKIKKKFILVKMRKNLGRILGTKNRGDTH